MITGRVTDDLDAILQLMIEGASGKRLEVNAVVDTGFNGYLTLPTKMVAELQLPWRYRQQGELADGTLHTFDVHEGSIDWDGQMRSIEVEVADADPLLGMALLLNHFLHIEVFSGGEVTVTPRS